MTMNSDRTPMWTVLHKIIFAFCFLLFEDAHCFEMSLGAQSTLPSRCSVRLEMAWSIPNNPPSWIPKTPSSLRAFGTWYEEISDPTHRATSYDCYELEDGFSLHSPAYDWPSSEGTEDELSNAEHYVMSIQQNADHLRGWGIDDMPTLFARSFS